LILYLLTLAVSLLLKDYSIKKHTNGQTDTTERITTYSI